ncbi:glycerophosphoryl diester phosphodiesterase membrane domain-containing protein [Microbacterium esteraromaticum]|uniref:glycerophosphoryl diester phosphodiesterase membrane domain-containing protein n=1 Tax=Microbacterium esteraromaticum TaxID=57043 RepID=UPI0019D360F8|nr:glycerophosphoryl diester phosphodiesterase membrane domain-containing protein [Microbacterium esteraromaticum]MBN7793996.1 glycerophosphoryl diester phosphodiesterase membrane domain-containing protein [Microbacterium esteraromaticum]
MTTPASTTEADAGFWRQTAALLRDAVTMVRGSGLRMLWFIVLSQLIIVLIASPVLRWVFQQVLRSAGMTGLDLGTLRPDQLGIGTLVLLIVICVLALWAVSLQFSAIVLLLDDENHEPPSDSRPARRLTTALVRVWRKLLRPSSVPLIAYLFLFLPLSGFGFASLLTSKITIPFFISNELVKSGSGTMILMVLVGGILFVNARLALTMPIFALTGATGGQAVRASWRLTRRGPGVRLVLAVAVLMLGAALALTALTALALVPTMVSDHYWPDASTVVAAMSLGIAQVIGALLSGIVVACIAGVMIAALRRRDGDVAGIADLPQVGASIRTARPERRDGAGRTAVFAVVALVGALLLGLGNIRVVEHVASGGDVLVLSHRGFADGGVENTISGLEAADAVGVDLVEMDVMQTKDGGFVVMHDVELSRLAGEALQVKDLTLDELTGITVRNHLGFEDRIPSLAEYVTRAAELDLPLLIEIKLSGAETDDHVDLLVAELERLDALEHHIYHSLDAPSVARLKQLRPDLTVGYTMAFAAEQAPRTPADFIVVEQWTATEQMQRSATQAGLGFMVWTVNDTPGIREHLRRGTDGIISDRPDVIRAEQASIVEQRGLTATLADALQRLVAFL